MGVVSRAGSQYTVLVSAFLALIVLLLAGYILKKKHDKSTTDSFYSGRQRAIPSGA